MKCHNSHLLNTFILHLPATTRARKLLIFPIEVTYNYPITNNTFTIKVKSHTVATLPTSTTLEAIGNGLRAFPSGVNFTDATLVLEGGATAEQNPRDATLLQMFNLNIKLILCKHCVATKQN